MAAVALLLGAVGHGRERAEEGRRWRCEEAEGATGPHPGGARRGAAGAAGPRRGGARRGDMAEPASSRRRTRGRGEREWVIEILGRLLEKIKFWGVIFFLLMTQIVEWVSDLSLRCWR